jgi:hypothetical protein
MRKIGTEIKANETSLKREDYQKELLKKIESIKEKVREGGGKKAMKNIKLKVNLPHERELQNLLIIPTNFMN